MTVSRSVLSCVLKTKIDIQQCHFLTKGNIWNYRKFLLQRKYLPNTKTLKQSVNSRKKFILSVQCFLGITDLVCPPEQPYLFLTI